MCPTLLRRRDQVVDAVVDAGLQPGLQLGLIIRNPLEQVHVLGDHGANVGSLEASRGGAQQRSARDRRCAQSEFGDTWH